MSKNIAQATIAEIDYKTVTASFGIAIFDPDKPDNDLIKQADTALYMAKDRGRNCTIIFDDSMS